MSQVVTLPPASALRPDGLLPGGWWHTSDDEPSRIVCDLCPRECHLKPGDRGFCFVRQNVGGEMMLTTYGRSTGFCIDPIEKKPLNHFLPGTSVLSFGTAGCNLGCKFCQNWDISKSREIERLSEQALPDAIAEAARSLGCHSVAYTYNDPVIWAEYAIDCAKACRAVGVKSVAVTAGYISPAARGPFYEYMDAANVDLKAFTEDFYYKITYAHLEPVLDTLRWLRRETNVWFEITNLVIPQANDSLDEIREMSDWILQDIGDDVPVHFTAFHPDWRMKDRPNTPHETLLAAREVARKQGLKYVYVGNVNDVANQSTYCPHCGTLLIERNWYELGQYNLRGDCCAKCGGHIAGVFAERPGDWGRKRVPVRIGNFSKPVAAPQVISLQSNPQQSKTGNGEGNPMSTENSGPQRPDLTDEQRRLIHRAACEIVAAESCGRTPKIADPTLGGAAVKNVMGAFVTVKRRGRLRGCCGTLGKPVTLIEAVDHAARRTAVEDVRMPPISPSELPYTDVDVTLLYGFRPLPGKGEARRDGVIVGRHGLQIQRGANSGLLLPSVATENGFDAETFLEHVCRKAGLPVTAWKDDATRILTFEGYMVSGQFDVDTLNGSSVRSAFTTQDATTMAGHCRNNVLAILQGATPSYYLPGCPDGNVQGVALTVHLPGTDAAPQFSKLSLRPGMPLQSTLYSLCETAANTLRNLGVRADALRNARVGLTLLTDPTMNGTVEEPDLRGVDPAKRIVLVNENGKSAWVFDPTKSADELLATAVREAQVSAPEMASVFSLAAVSSEAPVVVTSVPRAVGGSQVRPAGVAGMFYPADAGELNRLVDECLGNGDVTPESWPAVMVPHAGLIYSGRIAAQVFRRVKIPETVIVIGPKHTRFGVEWAVAPHEIWQIPGATISADQSLARRLTEAIPQLQLDFAAHQREHAIEVELPFLARLAPRSRVVGIAIGAGNLERCVRFATGLARVIGELPTPPLLVVSSDMNHFATDPENRILDEMAIKALETLNPATVYETITEHNISMCGYLPAVMVLETLRQLGRLSKSVRVGYATSADVTGDKSRVVGYAGMLFG